MVSFSRQFVLLIVGLALLLPLSISALAEPVTNYGAGPYNFYSDWMSPRVKSIDTRVLFVSDFATRRANSITPSVEKKSQTTSAGPVTNYGAGPYNFYSDWMSPRVKSIDTRVLFVSDFATRRANSIAPSVEKKSQTTSAGPVREYSEGQYDFYLNWMLPRVKPEQARVIEFLSRKTSGESNQVVSK